MKTTTPEMAAHLAMEVTTLCSCWKVVRRDGVTLGFTDHDRDLTIGGLVYESEQGYNRTAITKDSTFAVDNLDISGMLSSDLITDEDIRAGLFNYADVYISIVNWKNPEAGSVKMLRGHFGETSQTQNGLFTIELRSLAQTLNHNFIELYTPECKADFCDARCKLSIVTFRAIGTVKTVTDRLVFTFGIGDAVSAPTVNYASGIITFTAGPNINRSMEIDAYKTGEVTLFDAFPYPIKPGDTFEITPGCDKSRANCKRYDNIINFRGEPDVPGQDEYLSYPDSN